MTIWKLANPRSPGLSGEIISQSRVRIVICSFMGGYYSAFGIPNHPVYLAFALYSMTLLFYAQRSQAAWRIVPSLTLLLDNGFAIYGLHVTGERGAFLLFFLIHFSFAYGIRFGRSYLIASLTISCIGVTWLYRQSFPWQGHIHFLLSFLFGMPFISFYFYVLTSKLRRSEAKATMNADQTTQLLTFLAHDIRTPLHQLLIAIKKLQETSYTALSAPSLHHMEQLVNMMARMCSGVVGSPSVTVSALTKYTIETSNSLPATVNLRIVAFVELFRQRIESQGATLRYSLASDIAQNINIDISVVERALLNVISNAVRYCQNGYVEIRTRSEGSHGKTIRVEIENGFPSDPHNPEASFAPKTEDSSLFYGTSIGMDSIRAIALSAGGAFSFQVVNSSCFLSSLTLPANELPTACGVKSVYPVVVISNDFDLIERCAEKLNSVANVYRFPSFEKFTSHIESYGGEIAAIFTEYPDTDNPTALATFADFSAGHGLVVAICSDLEHLDQISIQSPRVKVAREAADNTWIQAMQLSEGLRMSETCPSTKMNYQLRTLASAKILALDDNPLNLSLLAVGLKNYGLSIKSISSLGAGMRELSKENYDILILDWNVGDCTALDFLQNIQNCRRSTSLRILLLTAQELEIEKMEIPFVENIRLLTKPIDNAAIFLAIKNLWLSNTYRAVGELESNPKELFFCDSYMEMDWSSDSIAMVDELLGEFLNSIQERLADLEIAGNVLAKEDVARRLHTLASMCYSVGAYALGDLFKIYQDRILSDAPVDASQSSRGFTGARDLLALTKMHISIFQLSIRARDVS